MVCVGYSTDALNDQRFRGMTLYACTSDSVVTTNKLFTSSTDGVWG